ncbi:MAG: DUF3987 domain-containing protein [Actinobacteria bacterium]|nr:DUF3987 domain-containing protein [Actinomycetota bacterium]MCA1806368.1 DUF3987 domain-containing protein [Actinomycetota bacterium]
MKRVPTKEFFEFLFEDNEGYLCVVEIDRNSNTKQKNVKQHFFVYPQELDGVLTLADAKKTQVDLYFAPFLLDQPTRKKQFISDTVTAWADGDLCPVDALKIQPSAVIRSSKTEDGQEKFHFYWKFDDLQPATVGENISKRIAYHHEDDGMDKSGWDLTQLLRIPDTYNHKYTPPLKVSPAIIDTEAIYSAEYFDRFYEEVEQDVDYIDVEAVDLPDKSAKEILTEYKSIISPRAVDLFVEVPVKNWSSALYELQCTLFEAGLSKEEVFVVANESACNKYARDNRPQSQLWKEVQKVGTQVAMKQEAPPADEDEVTNIIAENPPELLTDEQRALVRSNPSFIEEYTEWAKSLGDASPQYHPVGAFVILSSIMCGTVRIPTSFGTLIPNLWFMILADTTLTRKSTAMDIAMDLLFEVDDDVMLATDGSIEGLMTAMATRSGRPSVFLRDEVTGLIDAISKKEYMAGMMEMLTKMYDGRPMKRILRRETINVSDPRLVFFSGGIRNKMMEILDYQHVSSGFLPRFVFVTAESDITRIKPIGPPTEIGTDKREEMIESLIKMYDKYNAKPTRSNSTNSAVQFPSQWPVELTPDAWYLYNSYEVKMLDYAMKSLDPGIMTPMMDRLAKSGLKAAALIAASRMPEDKIIVGVEDMYHAFFYIEQWLRHTIYIVNNIGKSFDERLIQRLVDVVSSNSGVLRSEIMRRNHMSARDAEQIFLTMEQRGLIRREKKGGRGERIYSNAGKQY